MKKIETLWLKWKSAQEVARVLDEKARNMGERKPGCVPIFIFFGADGRIQGSSSPDPKDGNHNLEPNEWLLKNVAEVSYVIIKRPELNLDMILFKIV